MKKVEKYFISGLPLSGHDLMLTLTRRLSNKGYKLLYKKRELSIRALLKQKFLFIALQELVRRIIWKTYLCFFILTKKNSRIIFAWPQLVGFDILLKALKNNKVILYIMDNSFFCIRSYNTNPITNKECLDCLGFIKPHKLCLSFPKKYKKDENIRYLKLLKESASQIIFYSQNELQKSLLKKHFGDKIKVKVVGMNINVTKKHQEIIESKNPSYDIVFHGKSLIAKGIIYVIKLAEFLPDITFLIPDSKENVLEVLGKNYNFSENITFKKMDWESGLKEAVISARLVINPTLWSAPIEAALVKSSTYNQNVATVESVYGYEKEIKKIENHIRLSTDIFIAAKQLKNFFQQ